MQPVVRIRNLSKGFGSIRAVDTVTMDVSTGEMFGIVGPDGAGKTTTMRLLCGLLTPTSGSAEVFGFDLQKNPDAVKKHIGYLSQRFTLYGDLTVDQNIEFFAEINGVYDYHARREELLAFTRLAPFRTRLAEQLSGGMKQKLALACTLIHSPKLLLLDEPTTGVDPVSRRDFWKILQSLLSSGITIIMSTPYLDEAERCTRVALMSNGKILRIDDPSFLKRTIQADVVEIVCERAWEAARLIRQHVRDVEVQVFGDRLNLVLSQRQSDPQALEALLHAHGIRVTGSRVVTPSLENVFISLLTHEVSTETVS
ncbi:MAG: multidrug ABC transporter ATP-binding protein [Ignavibacteria bacterium]